MPKFLVRPAVKPWCSPVGETSDNGAPIYRETVRSDIIVLLLIRLGSVVIMYLAMYFAKGER